MRDSVRRFLLFFGTVTIGTVFIFVDIPVFYILLITILLGIIFLFLTGSLSLSDLRRKKKSAQEDTQKPKAPKKPSLREKFAEKAPSFYRIYCKVERLFAPIGRVAGGIKGRLTRSKKAPPSSKEVGLQASPPEKKRLFGGLRDRLSRKKKAGGTVPATPDLPDQPLSPQQQAAAAAGSIGAADRPSGGGADELFGDISLDEIDEELFNELGSDESPAELNTLRPDEDMNAGEGGEIGSLDMMDDVASILAQGGMVPDEEFEGDEFSPDIDLDSIDLDALDIDDDLEDPDEAPEPVRKEPKPAEEEEEVVEPQEEPEIQTIAANQGYQFTPDKGKTDPGFAALGGDADILSALKSDAKLVKKDLDLSLVRDLKDVEVTVEEIEEELSSVIIALGGKQEDDVSSSEGLISKKGEQVK
jgi:hypothetical protein